MRDGAPVVLDVQNLKTVFKIRGGEVHAVNDVSFDLKAGELLGVVGESGSGKSVTMMSLLGLLPSPPADVRGGTVTFEGRDLLQLDPRGLRGVRGARVGFIFQDPQVLIADEPTTALDVTIQAQILELMKELRDKLGMAVIWITHDLGVIAGIADRVMVMYGGQVVEQAPVRELFGNPQHPYTRALLTTIPKISGAREKRLTIIEGQPPIMNAAPSACAFRDRCPVAFDRCAQENPKRIAVNDSHDAACFLVEAVDA